MNFNDLIVALMRFSPETRDVMKRSLCMVETPVGGGFGTGVMVGGNTLLTAAHNFEDTPAKRSIVHHAESGTERRVKDAKIFKEDDLAIVTLAGRIAAATAVDIDTTTPPRPGLPVALVSFQDKRGCLHFNPRHRSPMTDFRFVKGVLLQNDTCVDMAEKSQSQRSSVALFHLRARVGDSGAGIFSQDGKLLTLYCTGNGLGSTGPSLEVFRHLVAKI